ECDGASYHSSVSARDRDRLRQHVLESLGWKLHRIWSTDWWFSAERELEKLHTRLQAAVAEEVASPQDTFTAEEPVPEDAVEQDSVLFAGHTPMQPTPAA